MLGLRTGLGLWRPSLLFADADAALTLRFITAFYAEGVQDFEMTLRVSI
jgi:hypothetical protein